MMNLGLTLYEKKIIEICCAARRGCSVIIISSKGSGGVRVLFSEDASFVNLIRQIVMTIALDEQLYFFLNKKGL